MPVTSISSSTTPPPSARQAGQLGKDDFLKLLLTQLRNQDPLRPMEDTEFIAQLAQFATLERMQEIGDRMAVLLEVEQLGQANGLIGKAIMALTGSEGESISGTVESVKMVEGNAVLMVDGKPVSLRDVLSVEEGDNWQLARASGLIGKEVAARVGEAGTLVTGQVESLKVENGGILLIVEGKALRLRDVVSMSEDKGGQLGQVSSLIGKEVEARVGTSGATVKGIVDSVEVLDGRLVLKVAGRAIRLNQVTSITRGPDPEA